MDDRDPVITIDDVRALARALGVAVQPVDPGAAQALLAAADGAADDPEGLLDLRIVLITTRRAWEGTVGAQLERRASRTLSAAKRLAIMTPEAVEESGTQS